MLALASVRITVIPLPVREAQNPNDNLQVLQISPREFGMRNDLNLAIALLTYLHRITQIAYSIIDLYFVVKEFFEGGNIKDFV